jgi:hypothetical protein
MKTNIINLFLVLLLISSCNKKEEKEFYYPNLEEFEKIQNKDLIRINSFTNYKEFKSEMWNFYRKKPGKNPVILLENDEYKYYIKYSNNYGCMPPILKLKNVIGISKDSVYKWEKNYPIEKLEHILKTDLLNYGKDNKFADNPKSLKIQLLNPEKETIINIENNLINVCRVYNKIKSQTKDSLELNIEFEELITLKPPPIPKDRNKFEIKKSE